MTTETLEPDKAEEPKEPKKSLGELRAEAHAARGEIASTLDALEYKLNIPKQLKIRGRRFSMGLRNLGEDNPAALAGIALGAVAVVGAVVWLGVRAVQRR
ncbi:DUF3618 domain-containing protein [Glaciibacter superstes]|uniref:DUF3618 domain-containing protein n=1 Tax=Glaciibacter superstes TaxID=501023 RepID=UPI0003B501ED|nr:DUF3618 domain-containing protein [Glaciibacter superstes]